MSFRKNNIEKIKADLSNSISTRKNELDDIKDYEQALRIEALEKLISSVNNSSNTNTILSNDLIARLSALEARYNLTLPS
jgi:hypothetical protein